MLVDNPVVSTLVEAGILNKTNHLGLDTSAIQKNIIGAGTIDGAPLLRRTDRRQHARPLLQQEVLTAAHVDPASIKDWASLTAALKKVKSAG